jgi:hypothetical protein
MAARRLLIVVLVLLGLSTLAAALIPQSGVREGETTQSTTTTTTPSPAPAFVPPTKIMVGGKKFPIVAPVHVGDQFTLLVRSRVPAEIEIPEFGQLAFAAPQAPARFELLASTPGTFGILIANTEKVVAQIRVLPPGEKGKKSAKRKRPKRRARAESGSAS